MDQGRPTLDYLPQRGFDFEMPTFIGGSPNGITPEIFAEFVVFYATTFLVSSRKFSRRAMPEAVDY